MKKNRKLIIIGIISIIIISCVHIFKLEGNDICGFYIIKSKNPDYKINGGYFTISADAMDKWFSTFSVQRIDQDIYLNVESQTLNLCYKDKCKFRSSSGVNITEENINEEKVTVSSPKMKYKNLGFTCLNFFSNPIDDIINLGEDLKNYSLETVYRYKDGTMKTEKIELEFEYKEISKGCTICSGSANGPRGIVKGIISSVF